MPMQIEAAGPETLLSPSGYYRSHCGYCSTSNRSYKYGATTASLQPSDYKILVDRGWRRSGTFLYKPDCRHSCCPQYAVRVDALAFDSTKDQRRAVNRWNRHVLGQDYLYKLARLCPQTREEKKLRRTRFCLNEAIHLSEYQNLKRPLEKKAAAPIGPDHRFEVTLEPDHFTDEKYALFVDYQRNTHGEDDTTESSFRRFLCSGMQQTVQNESGQAQRLGSYHQCYRLNGRLVAVGVLDLMPSCVSSVYLMYLEEFAEWNFGKISALREIDLAIEGGYHYYYMGYYIHTCTKMRYKAKYKPTYILDPEIYTWDPLDADVLQRMTVRKYVSMAYERKYNLPALPSESFQSGIVDAPTHTGQQSSMNIAQKDLDNLIGYINASSAPEANPRRPYRSVFEANTPGVMSVEEVERDIDLGSWKLKFGDELVMLRDIINWDNGATSNPTKIKGIVAELAACIGPLLVKRTVLDFH